MSLEIRESVFHINLIFYINIFIAIQKIDFTFKIDNNIYIF